MNKLAWCATLLFFCQTTLALEESGLKDSLKSLAVPYFNTAADQVMSAKGAVKIHYRIFPAANPDKGTIVIVNGRGEFMRMYAELAYDLKDSGYSIVMYDQRSGQGESDRLIPDSLKGYVDNYQDYVDDLAQLMSDIVVPQARGDIFLLAHSLGGAVATAYLIQHPKGVAALVASSPMYGIQLPLGIPDDAGLLTEEAAVDIGLGQVYAIGRGADEWNAPYDGNSLTSSPNRYAFLLHEEKSNPNFVLGGPTNKWVAEGLKIGMYDCDKASELHTPTLIFSAGNERLVQPEKNSLFTTRAGSRIFTFSSARHDVFMEKDSIRNQAIASTLDFFKRYSSLASVAKAQ